MAHYVNREDIQIESETYQVDCTRTINAAIQDKNVFTENPSYERYVPTEIQFSLSTKGLESNINMTIPYANTLTEIEATYSRICQYDGVSQWRVLETTLDSEAKTLTAFTKTSGTIGVFLNDYWYSTYTQEIANEYPLWTYIRQSKESNGQRFLNYFAMSIERAKLEGEEIKQQKFIDTIDIQALDWVFVYEIPIISANDDVNFYDGTDVVTRTTIPIIETLQDFFYNKKEGGGIIDYANRRFYSRKNYLQFNGEITNYANRQTFTASGLPYQIWNAFDEFGLLVGVQRLYRETNTNLKERIKDVFRYPANSGDNGLTNGLARELNMIKRVTWKDDTKNLYLKGIGLDPRTLLVDGQPLQPNEFTVDEFQNLLIQARYQGKEHIVSFIQYIQKYELYDKTNEDLYGMMFEEDGQSSTLLNKWVDYINHVAPVMWGSFNWDEGYWDTITKELTGIGYLPNMWDSSIDIWKDYTFNPKRWEGKKVWQS